MNCELRAGDLLKTHFQIVGCYNAMSLSGTFVQVPPCAMLLVVEISTFRDHMGFGIEHCRFLTTSGLFWAKKTHVELNVKKL